MNRREFVKWLALIAAGANALPEQIAAYEKYYEVNSPHTSELVAIDEIIICGLADKSIPVTFEMGQIVFGINLFGGILRWIPAPDAKIIRPQLSIKWKFIPLPDPEFYTGHISYVDQNARRHYQSLSAMSL